MEIKQKDTTILRELAKKYMEIATLPTQKNKLEMWKAFNRHDKVRPMVVIDQLPWNELNYDGSLTCLVEDPFLRNIEYEMRCEIFRWKNFPVDMVVEPFIKIPFSVENSGYGMQIVEETRTSELENSVSSHAYINQIEDKEDLEKIKDVKLTLDAEKSNEWLQTTKFIFDGIAPVYQKGGFYFSLQIWDVIAQLMGVETIYYDLVDRPEFIHKMMDKFTNSALAGIEQMNALNLSDDISKTCHCSYTYNDFLLPDFAAGKGGTSQNSWAFSMAQLFTSASPSTTDEFEIPYISKISEKFGMIYYGCCERLDDRLDIVQKLPNLKKISCSPWSNRENFAEKLRKDIIMSNKPTPSFLAETTINYDEIKADLIRTCDAAKRNNVSLELILKDISTVRNHPQRLTEWAKVAMQVVENY